MRRWYLSLAILGCTIFGLKAEEIPFTKSAGVFYVPVELNETLTLDFIIDTGAADVVLPPDVVLTLMRTGTISQEDFLEARTYILADGKKVESPQLLMKSLKVGNRVIPNVVASVGEVDSPLLLGQSFLERLGSYTMDSERQKLVLAAPRKEQEAAKVPDLARMDSAADLELKRPQEAVMSFFHVVSSRRFDLSWALLSHYSQDRIVELVSQEEKSLTREKIRELFEANDPSIQRGFWTSYRKDSGVLYFTQEATYQPLSQKRNAAIVKVQVRDQSMDFQVYREEGQWRLGLMESVEALSSAAAK